MCVRTPWSPGLWQSLHDLRCVGLHLHSPAYFSLEPKVRPGFQRVLPVTLRLLTEVAGWWQSFYVLSSASSVPAGEPPGPPLIVTAVQYCETQAGCNLPRLKNSLCHRPSMPCPHSYPPNWAFSLTECHAAILFSFSFCRRWHNLLFES